MNTKDFKKPEGARKLSPLEMNKLAILKAHTVITFTDKDNAVEDTSQIISRVK